MGALNDMPEYCHRGALGSVPRRLWIAWILLRHGMSTLLTLARCSEGGGTLISGMNKHGHRRVSPELLNAKMELELYLRD